MIHASSKTRFAVQYALAALIAFAGGAVLLRGTAFPLGMPGPGLLTSVVAYLLIVTGAFLVVMAATQLVRARGSHGSQRRR